MSYMELPLKTIHYTSRNFKDLARPSVWNTGDPKLNVQQFQFKDQVVGDV